MHVFRKEEKESVEILALLYSRRGFILLCSILSALALMLFSLFVLPEKYSSEAIIYPTPSNSQESILENPSFGFEGHSNQLLQVLQSNTLRERLIDEFDLARYYAIDTTRHDWYSKLNREMEEDINFERTAYHSVSITASTESPELSANIVNYIVDEINTLLQEIFRNNIQQTYRDYEEEYLAKRSYVRSLLDSLVFLKNQNTDQALSHLNTQIEQSYREINSLRNRIEQISESHDIYSYEAQVSLLSNQVANASAHYNHFKGQYDELNQVLSPRDTALLKIKGEMKGARRNADTSMAQLQKLGTVKDEYSELNLLLEHALERYAQMKSQKQDLENAYEPTIQTAGLGKLQSELEFSQEQLQELKARYEKARQKLENKLPGIYVVSRGRPNYKKASPSHSKNTLLGLGLGLLFSTGWVLGKARWRKIKPQLQEHR